MTNDEGGRGFREGIYLSNSIRICEASICEQSLDGDQFYFGFQCRYLIRRYMDNISKLCLIPCHIGEAATMLISNSFE